MNEQIPKKCKHEPEGYHRLDDPVTVGLPAKVAHRCKLCNALIAKKYPWEAEWELVEGLVA